MPFIATAPAEAVTLSTTGSIDESEQSKSAALVRLNELTTLLQTCGVPGLRGLGTLNIEGRCLAKQGLVTPKTPMGPNTAFIDRFRTWSDATGTLEPSAGVGFPLAGSAMPIAIKFPYWAAEKIVIAPGTQVVLEWPLAHLVMLAEHIVIGQGVTFTWHQPGPSFSPKQPKPKPETPFPPPIPDHLGGTRGYAGLPGLVGDGGADGKNAPTFEIWTLKLKGNPVFDLGGQAGFRGGRGGDGGDGGPGSKGKAAVVAWERPIPNCKSGPGNGGDGGPGGRAGDGGSGGAGGHGGQLLVRAPKDDLLGMISGFMVTTSGGPSGAGGAPGNPGAGGPGGEGGNNPHKCSTSHGQRGRAGPSGSPGQPGRDGRAGGNFGARAVSLVPVTEDDFWRKATDPALVELTPTWVRAGDLVTAAARRLEPSDRLFIDGAPFPVTIVGAELARFTVPLLHGGQRLVEMRRADGRVSNPATIYVQPVLTPLASQERIRPGSRVTLQGSGFVRGMRVRANTLELPDVEVSDAATVTFTLLRSPDVPPRPAGEPVNVSVVLPDGTKSNTVELILDTYRILALGDSVVWGQGLQEPHKMHAQVAAAVKAASGGMQVYTTLLAHSGAIIGVGRTTTRSAIHPEVPTDHPTILQQCANAAVDDADTVDLVIVDGGINDVDVRTILNPLTTTAELKAKIERVFSGDLVSLLEQVLTNYPNAQVVVTGYYPIVSNESDLTLLPLMLSGIGVDLLTGVIGGSAVISKTVLKSTITNAATFARESRTRIARAVDTANAALASPRVVFADPRFAPTNAALASDPWLFGINPDGSPQDNPAVSIPRAAACNSHCSGSDATICERASAGHPNPTGARRFASAILDTLAWQTLATPKQLAPPHDHISSSQDMRLTWAPVEHATRYQVEIEHAEPPAGPFVAWLQQDCVDTTFAFRHIGAQPGRWRVTALADGYAPSAPSPWRRFEYRPTPLTTPVLLAPDDGASFSHFPRTTALQWAPVDAADRYHVEIEYSAPPTWTFLPLHGREVTGCEFTFDHVGDQPGRWRVTARANGKAPSQPSHWRTFTYNTARAPLPTPQLSTPPEGAILNTYPRITTLRWQPVAGATGYRVEVVRGLQSPQSGVQWIEPPATYLITDTCHTFEFCGAQPGRWRITALDDTKRHTDSAPSQWNTFTYTI
jgi:lysophospholipase L1-like esterase